MGSMGSMGGMGGMSPTRFGVDMVFGFLPRVGGPAVIHVTSPSGSGCEMWERFKRRPRMFPKELFLREPCRDGEEARRWRWKYFCWAARMMGLRWLDLGTAVNKTPFAMKGRCSEVVVRR